MKSLEFIFSQFVAPDFFGREFTSKDGEGIRKANRLPREIEEVRKGEERW